MVEQSGFTWCYQKLNSSYDHQRLAVEIHRVFLDGFGLESGWSVEGVQRALYRSNYLGLLYDEKNLLVGYAMYTIPDEPLMGHYFLWEDATCLRKVAQGKRGSINPKALIEQFFVDRTIGWIGGRTQNPILIKRYAKFGTLFPFDSTYENGVGKKVMDYLCRNMKEVRETHHLDRANGICHGVYRDGKLGDYPIEVPGTEMYEEQLSHWGFNRSLGDAVLVVSRLREPVK